jgi:hypothetical protein
MPVEYTIAQEALRQLELVDEMPHFGDNNYVRVVLEIGIFIITCWAKIDCFFWLHSSHLRNFNLYPISHLTVRWNVKVLVKMILLN